MSRGKLDINGSLNLIRGKGKNPGVCLYSIYECTRNSNHHNFSGGRVRVVGWDKNRIQLQTIYHPKGKKTSTVRNNWTVKYNYFIRNYTHVKKICKGKNCKCGGRAVPVEYFYKGNPLFFWDGLQPTCKVDRDALLHSDASKRNRQKALAAKSHGKGTKSHGKGTKSHGKGTKRRRELPLSVSGQAYRKTKTQKQDIANPANTDEILSEIQSIIKQVQLLESTFKNFIKEKKNQKPDTDYKKLVEDIRGVIQQGVV